MFELTTIQIHINKQLKTNRLFRHQYIHYGYRDRQV